MKSLLKISRSSRSKLILLAIAVPIVITGGVLAYSTNAPTKRTGDGTKTEQNTSTNKISERTDDSKKVDKAPTYQVTSESTVTTPTQSATQAPQITQTPKVTIKQSPQTATVTTPQESTVVTTPTAPTCNEDMKSAYTSLYTSQVNAENANWTKKINAWNSEAANRGIAFSGYTQGMIDENKPAHDARLAQLQVQYYHDLILINCSP